MARRPIPVPAGGLAASPDVGTNTPEPTDEAVTVTSEVTTPADPVTGGAPVPVTDPAPAAGETAPAAADGPLLADALLQVGQAEPASGTFSVAVSDDPNAGIPEGFFAADAALHGDDSIPAVAARLPGNEQPEQVTIKIATPSDEPVQPRINSRTQAELAAGAAALERRKARG